MKKGLLVVLLIFLSIWPAIWNGYPILYMDSGWYIGDAFWGYTPRNYALAYPYFIRAAAMIYPSLWMVVLLQAALMVYTLFQLLDALGFARQFSKKFLISSLLFLFTPLSWVVSHIMPDVFTAILACGAAVMLLSPLERSINRLFLFCLTVYACACHDSHIVLIAATIMALIIISFIRRSSAASLKCLILPAACLCFAALLVFGLNFKRTGNFYLGQSGSVYLANRLIEDGILQKLLSEQCEKEYYALCPYQDKLPQERGAFLWEPETSPLYKIGGWEKFGQATCAYDICFV